MKLYATTTSERASKGQGGNKFIDVFINDDNGCMLATLKIELSNDTIGDVINAKVDFAEHLYVNGHHWLDSEIIEKKDFEARQICTHIFSTAKYENKKLLGYICNNCGELEQTNPQYLKGKRQKGESISGCLHEEWRDNRCIKCGYNLN